jgi:hypothetical protein
MRKSFGLLVSAACIAMGAVAAELPGRTSDSVGEGNREKLVIPGGVEITTEKDAADMALPREKAPGVRFAKSDEFFRQYADRSKAPSGLYIFGAAFIPRELPDRLKAAGLTLRPDGTLVNAQGRQVTMLVWHRLVVAPGRARPMEQHTWLEEFGVGTAHAAEPYPLAGWTYSYSWSWETGYCTDVRTDTYANALGYQGGSWVPTNAQSLGTRAYAGAGTYDNWCINCSSQHTYAEVNNGCGWPGVVIVNYSAAAVVDKSQPSTPWFWQFGTP